MRAAARRALLLCVALLGSVLVTAQPAHAAEVTRATFSGQVSLVDCWTSDPVGPSFAWSCQYDAEVASTGCEETTPSGGEVPCTISGGGWAVGWTYTNASECASVGRLEVTISSSQHPDVPLAIDLVGEQSTITTVGEPTGAASGVLAFASLFASPHCWPGPAWVGVYALAYGAV